MRRTSFNKRYEYRWSRTGRVVVLLFSAVVATAISFIVVMRSVDDVDAAVTFIRKNLAISFAGGCAFYIILFILVKWAIDSFIHHDE